ncbi:hypothetical protein KLP28_09700 [Nocardioidaceae bacterium]|nr:hypothetical protein KLP28_09700 [Nocardioidaceae bacterium]
MPFSVLVVCLANVCRSPLGERLLTHRLAERDVADAYAVRSAGVRALEGRAMSPQSAVELEARGGSADDFTATQLGREHKGSDLVLVATRELRSKVLESFPGLMKRTFTIREIAAVLAHLADQAPEQLAAAQSPADLVRLAAAHRTAVTLGEEADVPDPIGRSDEVYAEVAALLDTALTGLADELARVAVPSPTSPADAARAASPSAG